MRMFQTSTVNQPICKQKVLYRTSLLQHEGMNSAHEHDVAEAGFCRGLDVEDGHAKSHGAEKGTVAHAT